MFNWLSSILENAIKPFKWWIVVAPWERALVVRLGKKAKVLNPGIHLRIPFLDRIFVQSIRLRSITASNISTTSKDGKSIVISIGASFSIENIEKLFDSLSTPETTIINQLSNSIVEYIGQNLFKDLSINNIQNDVFGPSVKNLLNYGLGSICVNITGFTACKAYRILNNDYTHGASLYNLDSIENSGERK